MALGTTAIVVPLVIASCAGTSSTGPTSASPSGTNTSVSALPVVRSDKRPNIVVIMTDDQRADDMNYLPITKRLIGGAGVTYNNSFVSFPLCCPSRATHLSGQYAHNHGVKDNELAFGGGNDSFDHTDTVPVWLQDAGYATAHVGKYLNEFGKTSEPKVLPGYTDFFTTIDPSTYQFWNYDVLDNGTRRSFGNATENYQTDVLAKRAVENIARLGAQPKPFYMTVWPLAPHSSTGKGSVVPLAPAPAPRHVGTKPNVRAPRPASFMEADRTDKPKALLDLLDRIADEVAKSGTTQEQIEALLDQIQQARAESLLAVDELVQQVIEALTATGQLDNTMVVFTSDNGWMMGEHAITLGKVVPYEESIRVPLLVRGPGFPKAAMANQPVSNVDIPATVLELAAVAAGLPQEGTSLLSVAKDPNLRKDRAVLIESTANGVHAYQGIRTPGWSYVRYADDGGEELYDLFADPHQLENKVNDPSFAKARDRFRREVDRLGSCRGSSCVTSIPGSDLR